MYDFNIKLILFKQNSVLTLLKIICLKNLAKIRLKKDKTTSRLKPHFCGFKLEVLLEVFKERCLCFSPLF